MPNLRIRSAADIGAVIPTVLGFVPAQSLVALGGKAPHLRIDLPSSAMALPAMVEGLANGINRHHTGGLLVLAAYTDDAEQARQAFLMMAQTFADVVTIKVAVQIIGDEWIDHSDVLGAGGDWPVSTSLPRGRTNGSLRLQAEAETAFSGRQTPVATRAELAEIFTTSGTPLISENMDAARLEVPDADWIRTTVSAWRSTREPLTDRDAARLLVALKFPDLRDVVTFSARRSDAAIDFDLWVDLVRRVVGSGFLVETMHACAQAALRAWLTGQGAVAWIAHDLGLDHAGAADTDGGLLGLVSTLLSGPVAPAEWESFVAHIEKATDPER